MVPVDIMVCVLHRIAWYGVSGGYVCGVPEDIRVRRVPEDIMVRVLTEVIMVCPEDMSYAGFRRI